MLDGAARLDELVAKAVHDGQPAIGITDHGNMYGTLEFYKECQQAGHQADHRHRGLHGPRPPRPSARRGAAGSTTRAVTPRAASKLYYHLTLLAENDAGLPQPDPAVAASPSSRATTTSRGSTGSCSSSYHDGLIATTGCLGGHVLQALLQGDEKGALDKAGRLQDIFGRDNLFVELQDHGLQAQRDTNPQADRARHARSARRCSPPTTRTTPTARTTRPTTRCCACRPAPLLTDPKRFKFEGQEHYLKTAARDALPVPRAPRGVRQHAVDRRARPTSTSSSASRSCPTSRCPTGFADDAALPRPPHVGGRHAAVGRRAARRRASSASPTSSRSSTTWASRRTS